MTTIKHTQKSGFTLIETLVAVSILALIITAALSLVSQSVSHSILTREELTATYLANEGIEIIREIRDTNLLNGLAWNTGFNNPQCGAGNSCRVSILNPSNGALVSPPIIQKCSGSCTFATTDFFNIHANAAGLYGHWGGGGTSTSFKRRVHTTRLSNDEYLVTVDVYYQKGSVVKTITVAESLFKLY